MRSFGLLGFPLGHSFSVPYFEKKFKEEGIMDCQYQAFPLDNINRFPELLASKKDWVGMNITIPYKEAIILYLDEMEDSAREIGAINTILFREGKLKGFNTDQFGFKNSLVPLLNKSFDKALILGTGGSSRAVAYVLKELGISYQWVSRGPGEKGLVYSEIDRHILEEYKLIINCTPLGMYPNVNSFPEIPYEYLTRDHILFDLIYNPLETEFLRKGKEMGARIQNGLPMLYLQAEASWAIWNAKE